MKNGPNITHSSDRREPQQLPLQYQIHSSGTAVISRRRFCLPVDSFIDCNDLTGSRPGSVSAYQREFGTGSVGSFSTDANTDLGASEEKKKQRLSEIESNLATTDLFNEAITLYAELGNVVKAEEILFQMEDLNRSQDSTIDMPDVDSYTAVMDAWMTQQTKLVKEEIGTEKRGEILQAAERLDGVLRRMERAAEPSGSTNDFTAAAVKPSSHHYDLTVIAWSRCLSKDRPVLAIRGVPQRAQAVLQRMETLSLDPKSGVRPTVETYNRVLEAWQNSQEHASARLAEEVYQRISVGPAGHLGIRPNDRTIRALLQLWAQSDLKTSAFHATGYLMRLQDLVEEGAEEMGPTIEDYEMVLKRWSQALDKHAARRAQAILRQMDRLYLDRVSDVRPTVACYRYVLISMSNSKAAELGPIANELIDRMEDRFLVPDSECFGATIRVWSRSACHKDTKKADVDAFAEKADEALQQMKDMYQRSNTTVVKPTTGNYNDVLKAHSKRKRDLSALRVEELLNEMETLNAQGDEDVLPDCDSYIFTMHALANSRLPDKLKRARKFLKQIEASSTTPNLGVYHALLTVCSSSRGSPHDTSYALRTAIKTVKKLKTMGECQPKPETYNLLMEACGALLPEGSEQTKAIESVFKNCCQDGLVNDKVMKKFKEVAPMDLYQSTVLLNAKSFSDGTVLPEEWTRNISHKIRTAEGRKPQPLSPDAGFIVTPSMVDHKMRRLRMKKNQNLLRGGRS